MYSFQTFSIGQILTAAQMNQVEASIRDHVHGASGVTGSGMVFVAPALGTPASGVLTNCTGTAAGLTAGNATTNANLTGHITSTGNTAVLGSFTKAQLNTAISDDDAAYLAAANILTEGTLTISPGTAVVPKLILKEYNTVADNAYIQVQNNAGTQLMAFGYARVADMFQISNSTATIFEVARATGVVQKGTVPLARMMRTEVQGSTTTASYVDLNLGTVNNGDRIMISSHLYRSTSAAYEGVSISQTGTGATIDFMGRSSLSNISQNPTGSLALNIPLSGICRVTGTGTLTLRIASSEGTVSTIYAHAIVLNNG